MSKHVLDIFLTTNTNNNPIEDPTTQHSPTRTQDRRSMLPSMPQHRRRRGSPPSLSCPFYGGSLLGRSTGMEIEARVNEAIKRFMGLCPENQELILENILRTAQGLEDVSPEFLHKARPHILDELKELLRITEDMDACPECGVGAKDGAGRTHIKGCTHAAPLEGGEGGEPEHSDDCGLGLGGECDCPAAPSETVTSSDKEGGLSETTKRAISSFVQILSGDEDGRALLEEHFPKDTASGGKEDPNHPGCKHL